MCLQFLYDYTYGWYIPLLGFWYTICLSWGFSIIYHVLQVSYTFSYGYWSSTITYAYGTMRITMCIFFRFSVQCVFSYLKNIQFPLRPYFANFHFPNQFCRYKVEMERVLSLDVFDEPEYLVVIHGWMTSVICTASFVPFV